MSPFLFNGPKALGRIATLGLTLLLLPKRRVGLGEEFGVTPPLGIRIGWDDEKYCLPIRVGEGEGERGKISSLGSVKIRSSCSAVTIWSHSVKASSHVQLICMAVCIPLSCAVSRFITSMLSSELGQLRFTEALLLRHRREVG